MHYLKLDEKEFPFVVDMGAVLNFCEKHDLDFTDYEKKITKPSYLKSFFTECLKRGYYKAGKTFDLDQDQVLDILSENMDFFLKVKTKSTTIEQPKDSKKK